MVFSRSINNLFRSNKTCAEFRMIYTMGTIAQFKVFGKNAEKAVSSAIDRLNEIDDKLSVFKKYSEISQINAASGEFPYKVSEDTFYLLNESLEYSRLLEGTFDPTIRPLVDLWGMDVNSENIPEEKDIKEKQKLVNYKDIVLNYDEHTLMLKHKHQSMDLGGIAKGYAADEVRDIFVENHVNSAIIDLGGNIFAFGKKADGTPWNVGIQDPLKPRGEFIGILNIKNKSVVTSGNYEKYFIKNNKKYHHIIDPRTGYPSESRLMSATIISDNSLDGDGLSTGVYILGVDKSMKLIEPMKGIDAIFIDEDKKVYATSGIRDSFILTNSEYEIIQDY